MSETTHTPDHTPVPETAPALVPYGLYERNSNLYIAQDEELLCGLLDPNNTPLPAQPGDKLYMNPGTHDWVIRMASIRSTLVRRWKNAQSDAETSQASLREAERRYEALGEALLEEANNRDWCSEYDEFADQWDLPRRQREYEVTMTVRITAGSDEEAEELVSGQVSLSAEYHSFVVDYPSYNASEA